MNKAALLIVVAFALTGCATPETYLKDPKTGQVVHCGGGTAGAWAGGMLGYSIEKNNDDQCVANYKAEGYAPFYPGYTSVPDQNSTSAPAQKPAS